MNKLLLTALLLIPFFSFSQVGINTTNINDGVMLQIESNNKGILIPRIALQAVTDNTTIPGTLTNGTLIYNTTVSAALSEGFYFWKTTQWTKFTSGDEKNIYNEDNKLTGNRLVDINGNFLNFSNGTNSAFRIAANRQITLGGYTGAAFAGNPTNILGVDALGNVVNLPAENAFLSANSDWFEANTESPPNAITDNIYTRGEVGINITNPNAPLHIFEATGTAASALDGTIVLEHGNNGGSSSIVFKSNANAGSDFAYISYDDNGSGNGTPGENSLLEIGTQNDTPTGFPTGVDDINIAASGSVGISNTAPNGSSSLDLGARDRGLLINRVELTATNNAAPIANPANGLLVYNIATAGAAPNNVIPGFYYWQTNTWIPLAAGETANQGIQYYSYDTTGTSPNVQNLIYTTKVTKSGEYYGALNSAGALATMNPTLNSEGFVIKMVGTYEVKNTGNFTFTEVCDDGARIYIDGSLIHNVWVDGAGDTNSSTIRLAKGKHQIEFWYYENAGGENFSFTWGANPDGNTGVIQASQFTIE